MTEGDKCFRMHAENGTVISETVPDLQCTHEEADTRMLLHAKHAAENGSQSVVIKTPDTDVEVLAYHFKNDIHASLYVLTGTKQRSRFVDIGSVSSKLGRNMCQALPGLHSMTGCDTTSAFSGKGKAKAFKLVTGDADMCVTMQQLGNGSCS